MIGAMIAPVKRYEPLMDNRTPYPEIEANRTGMLKVSELHQIYFEESGYPGGKPVLFVHGGPGAGTKPDHRRTFDPAAYRIVVFDQRGCGRSTPHGALEDNTTRHMIEDMEALRVHLEIERWQIFGGSWGSTLGIAYAEAHPERVSELVLRGIFLARRSELLWLYQEGASALYPDEWEHYLAPIPPDERGDMMAAYYKRLTNADEAVRLEAAKAWSVWEGATLSLLRDEVRITEFGGKSFAVALARIECHYFVNRCFFERDSQLLDDIDTIRHIPAVLVQGRYDVVTPMRTAWDLHRAWPEADLRIVADAGHAQSEPGITHELIAATDRFRERR